MQTKQSDDQDQNIADDQFSDLIDRTWSKREQEKLAKKASALDSGAISDAESSPDSPQSTRADNLESNKGGWFKDKGSQKTKQAGKFKRNKATAAGIVGLIAGLIFGGLSIIQGPFQIIHLSNVVADVFFARNSESNDITVRRVYNMVTSQREKNSLGVLASVLAAKHRVRLEDAGVKMIFETENDKGRAKLQSLELDPKSEYGSKMIARAKTLGAEPIDLPNGNKSINTRGFDGGKIGRDLIAYSTHLEGKKGVTGLISKRRLKRLAGVNFHPLNISKRGLETYSDYAKRRRAERAQEASHGTKQGRVGSVDGGKDENGNNRPVDGDVGSDGQKAANLVDDINKTQDPFEKKNKIQSLRSSSLFRGAGGGAAIVAIVCAVRDTGNNVQQYKILNVILPLIRLLQQYVSGGSQVQAMEDIDLYEVGSIVEPLYDEEDGSSWAAAMPLKAAYGEDGGEDIDPATKAQIVGAYTGEKPAFFGAVDNIPFVGSACRLNSWFGNLPGIKQLGDISSKLLDGLASVTTGKSVSDWMAELVKVLAGGPIDTLAQGAQLGNYLAFGGLLSSNATAISAGGGTLSAQQTYEWREYTNELQVAELRSRSFSERMFDLSAYDSLAGGLLMRSGSFTQPKGLANFAQTGPLGLIASPFKSFAKILTPKSMAQTIHGYDYGIPEFGIPLAQLNSERYEDIYENFDRLEDNDFAGLKEANKRWGKCFGNPLDDMGKIRDKQIDTYEHVLGKDCTSSYGIQEFQDYQMYIIDNVTIKSLACYESISQESCNEIGIGNVTDPVRQPGSGNGKIVGDPYTDSTSVPCAAGTEELPGTHDAYVNGDRFSVKLCALTNLPSSSEEDNPGGVFYTEGANGRAVVNSRVSGAWYALVRDATSAGITLSASSSFRSMAHQEALWARNPNPKKVARPGHSSHQAGVAIDFNGIGKENEEAQDCSSRVREPGNPMWEWLYHNAESYGFKQYSAEAWHWDAYPSPNRCGAS